MNRKQQLQQKMISEGFPAELIEPLARLFKMRERITVRLLPKEAWVAVGLLQFADRNPALDEQSHEALRWFAGALIEALVNIDPILEPYIMAGWDPSKDVPIKREGRD
jgi:hypothetical protein